MRALTRLKHLVIVVPGIGGSTLRTPEGGKPWDSSLRHIASSAMRPSRLSLGAHPELIPHGLLRHIRIAGPFVLPGYQQLTASLANTFPGAKFDISRPGSEQDLDADVVLFPYDFRVSVQRTAKHLAADIHARLKGLSNEGRTRRVVVVAHSLGGLVARYWLGPLDGARHCAALITLGTPHRGAPKALDALVNGPRVGPVRLTALRGELRDWPSIYELLPRYHAVRRAADGVTLYPYELDPSTVTQLTDAKAPGAGASFTRRAKDAFEVHRDIEQAWTELSASAGCPPVMPVYAQGHGTPLQAELSESGELTVSRRPAPWLARQREEGDGTVPFISAIPLELDLEDGDTEQEKRRLSWRPTTETHLALPGAIVVNEILEQLSGSSGSSVRGSGEPDRPWLGFDLDETVLADLPFRVTVRLRGTEPDERTAIRIQITAEDPRGHRTGWLPCTAAGDGVAWSAAIDPLPAGLYTVEARATGVPRTGRLSNSAPLGVINISNREEQT